MQSLYIRSIFKPILLILILSLLLVLPPSLVLANGGEVHSVDESLNELFQSQSVSGISQLTCSKVTDDQFEELGDAVMSVMHPDAQQHSMMDTMMGGEGSDSLKTAHIMMGRSYLGCFTGVTRDGGMQTMMGMTTGMMGNFFGPWGMASMGSVNMLLFWGLVIAGVIALASWLMVQTKGGVEKRSALTILKERYARGEISKKEFEEKKQDLE